MDREEKRDQDVLIFEGFGATQRNNVPSDLMTLYQLSTYSLNCPKMQFGGS